jgi:hypothetical protein
VCHTFGSPGYTNKPLIVRLKSKRLKMRISVLLVLRAISFKIASYIAKQRLINALGSHILHNIQLLILIPLKISMLHTSH